jgi:hypothetical protein
MTLEEFESVASCPRSIVSLATAGTTNDGFSRIDVDVEFTVVPLLSVTHTWNDHVPVALLVVEANV